MADILALIFTEDRIRAAQLAVTAIINAIPALARYKITPQTPPLHQEGDTISSHTVQIFVIIDAVIAGLSFRPCADLVNDPVIDLALHDAETAIRESPALFRAYALMHDLAKPDRLLLVAASGTVGEQEGFVKSNKRSSEYTTTSELMRFDKLRRAGLAAGIEATFDDADHAIIAP